MDETDDSVGQMTMIAKSRKHNELIKKARTRTEEETSNFDESKIIRAFSNQAFMQS